MFYEVIPTGKIEKLTYNFDASLLPGQIVLVPIGKRQVPGIVIKKVAQPDFQTKSILKVLYSTSLPTHLLKTIDFIHDYYLAPSGMAASLLLPNGVEKKRRKTEQMFGNSQKTEQPINLPKIELNKAQKNALEALKAPATFAFWLLYSYYCDYERKQRHCD